jgi:ATP-dependent protease Clp ATPase subunit
MFNTRGTLFAFAGAFVGLETQIQKCTGNSIGFGGEVLSGSRQEAVLYEALQEYGMIPEFINRLTGIIVFPEPSLEQLCAIAVRSIIPMYNRLLAPTAEIAVCAEAVRYIADCSRQSKTYARGIKSVLARVVEGIVYDEISGKIVVSETEVRQVIDAIGLVQTTPTPLPAAVAA